MAGEMLSTIDIVYLLAVRGGIDKQTRALQLAIAQATTAMEDVAKAVGPSKSSAMVQAMMSMMSRRGSGAGPTPAPALPPTSTLTR
jgi:hypothetical protein